MNNDNIKRVAVLYSGAKHSGGIETYLENLFEYADPERVELTLFSIGDWELTKKLKVKKYNVKSFDGTRINPLTIYKIARSLKDGGYSLLVTQGTVANAYGRSASILCGVPTLTTLHSEKEGDYPNSIVRFIYETSDMVVRWRTKRYIAASEFLKDQAIASGVHPEKIEVVYNGVKAPRSYPKKKENKRIVIGSISRLHPVKNFDALILAMDKLSKDGCDLKIWGEGEERRALETKIKDLGLLDNVSLPGYTKDIWGALSEVDIYVQPSLSEGFGISVVEAQLAGLPVVVCPGGALRELVENGRTGIIAKGFTANDIANAIFKYIENPKLAERCSGAGEESAARRFDIKGWAEKTIDVYLKTAQNRKV
jgi:glycosyltransferase involved in cell wall biosynthesis